MNSPLWMHLFCYFIIIVLYFRADRYKKAIDNPYFCKIKEKEKENECLCGSTFVNNCEYNVWYVCVHCVCVCLNI